jgi:hypothetical protein
VAGPRVETILVRRTLLPLCMAVKINLLLKMKKLFNYIFREILLAMPGQRSHIVALTFNQYFYG